MNDELSRELETIVEMFGEVFNSLFDSLKEVCESIKELWNEIEEYCSNNSKNDNSAHLAYVVPASQINIIGNNASYMAEFTRWLIALNLILSFHLKIPPIIRLQWSGI